MTLIIAACVSDWLVFTYSAWQILRVRVLLPEVLSESDSIILQKTYYYQYFSRVKSDIIARYIGVSGKTINESGSV